ncbi:MAG: hydrogenase maturation nickel metallochaperone HypA [Sporomusaceae bacterium]|nr:hydrogenase maturation nickel metallochaperone HypA [Sporomusaceae bacterium]
MHEMAIAEGILDLVKDMQAKYEFRIVREVHLLVGEMAGVEADSLFFCFEAVTAGTFCSGAKLFIQKTPLIGSCCECGKEFPIENYKFLCPSCESRAVTILSGRELKVDHLEVD